MRQIFRLVLFLSSMSALACTQQQQTPSQPTQSAPQPGSGPTIEQTIDFINQAFAKRGPLTVDLSDNGGGQNLTMKTTYKAQELKLEAGCSLAYAQTHFDFTSVAGEAADYFVNKNYEVTDHFLLRLDSSDAPEISVTSNSSGTPNVYWIKDNIPFKQLPYETQDQTPTPFPPSKGYSFAGFVRSVSGSTVVAITDYGKLVSIELFPKAEITYSGNATSISPGAFITASDIGPVFKKKEHLSQNIVDADHVAHPFFGPFPTEGEAKRVAKALIHAMVLCHKDTAPSVF